MTKDKNTPSDNDQPPQESIQFPCDKLFQLSLENPEVMRECIKTHLPPDLAARMQLDTLEQQKGTFISQEYRTHRTDVLYRVQVDNKDAYLYLLIEHQSTVDSWMPFRMFCYMVRVLEWQHKKNQNQPLAPIYPLLIYTHST